MSRYILAPAAQEDLDIARGYNIHPPRYNKKAVKIEVDIPISEEALDENAKDRLRRDALEAALLRLFNERRISSTEAAADLGLTRIQFMELTRRRGIAH